MATIEEAWAAAVANHQAGRGMEAEQVCRQIVAADPGFADAWHLLALLAGRAGNAAVAIECLEKVIRLKPDFAAAHSNLGAALHVQGLLAEACECYRRALALRPEMAEARSNLGTAMAALGRVDEAIECFRGALVQMPNRAELHNNLGDALQKSGQLNEAIAEYGRAIELNPNFAEAHNNLGTALKEQGEFDQAESGYRRAVELRPEFAEGHCNLATTLKEAGRLEEAIESYRRALALKPDFAEAQHGMGTALRELGEFEAALACFDRALALRPNFPEAHFSRAALKLLKGDFAEGWKEYQWRWKTKQLVARKFAQPQWDGGSLVGKTILLHAEQGLGDTLQFVRYAPLVKKLGGNVVFECPPGLMKLLASCAGIDQLVGAGDELPTFDVHAPLLTVPAILGTTLDTIPAKVPYLFADRGLVELWRERLAAEVGWRRLSEGLPHDDCGTLREPQAPTFRIGINWQGREGRGPYRRRDIPKEHFERLAELPGVRLISLQKQEFQVQSSKFKVEGEEFKVQGSRFKVADGQKQENGGPAAAIGVLVPPYEIDGVHGAFMDTAAIMTNLDLVITSDTSVAHVAGAIGAPVWVVLPAVAEWRWLLGREDSPWYPTMRLLRQKRTGDWSGVFEEVRKNLEECLRWRGA